MTFDNFCKENNVFIKNSAIISELADPKVFKNSTIASKTDIYSVEDATHSIEISKCFYADCYLYQCLEELLDNPTSDVLSPKSVADFKETIACLFKHYPVCNLKGLNSEDITSKDPKSPFNHERAINLCCEWFSILFRHNSSLCTKLFPIIAFILGDSYEYIKKMKSTINFDEWLYRFIKSNLRGNYQFTYLFSLIKGSETQKRSCITLGSDTLNSLKKRFSYSWSPISDAWQLHEIIRSQYVSIDDYYIQNFFNFIEESSIRSNLRSNKSRRLEHKFSDSPLIGENFIAFLHFLRDLQSMNNTWCNYDPTLTMYAINRITQWITPFTTRTIPLIIPAYNAFFPLTCSYFNANLMYDRLETNEPKWEFYNHISKTEFKPQLDREQISTSKYINYLKTQNSTFINELLDDLKDLDDISTKEFKKFAEDDLYMSKIETYLKDKDFVNLSELLTYFKDMNDELISEEVTCPINTEVEECLFETKEVLLSIFTEYYQHSNIYPISKKEISIINDYYKIFESWYTTTPNSEKQNFRFFLNSRAKKIFSRFINYEKDDIFLPTKKHLSPKNNKSRNLGYFYCLCYNFTTKLIPTL